MDASTSHTPSEIVIEMIDVTVVALDGAAVTLEGVNWRVASGDYWVIAGLHNSGKTDLLTTTAGLMPPIRGTLRLFGHEVSYAAEDELLASRRRTGMIFERGARLLHHLTAAGNLLLPVQYHRNCSAREAKEYLDPLITALELGEWLETAPRRLSLNWRQRFGLARALALQPDLMLLDNPVAGLDPRETCWWIDTLNRLAVGQHPWMPSKSVTLVVTCDNIRPWQSQGRQFAILREKRCEVLGSREEAFARAEAHFSEFLELEPAPS
jgi:ABC-type transporter Mla maintaining outer membrane lipid asymmetry ATPase subunit MlaF